MLEGHAEGTLADVAKNRVTPVSSSIMLSVQKKANPNRQSMAGLHRQKKKANPNPQTKWIVELVSATCMQTTLKHIPELEDVVRVVALKQERPRR